LVIFDVDRGIRHTFSDLVINGNRYFPSETIRERMAIQPADTLQRHGIFSSALLTRDLSVITGLYQANGFQQVKASSRVTDDYKGKSGRLRVDIDIVEGSQTLVRSVHIAGNEHFSDDLLLSQLSTIGGQPFSSYLLANDRDSIVSYYFDRGFPDVQVETAAQPVSGVPNRQDVVFTVTEGRQVFVDKILISGLRYTPLRPEHLQSSRRRARKPRGKRGQKEPHASSGRSEAIHVRLRTRFPGADRKRK
jgi:outer membrane protein assembly factor BamA